MVQTTTEVVRDGKSGELALEIVVSGDVVILNAGFSRGCKKILLQKAYKKS